MKNTTRLLLGLFASLLFAAGSSLAAVGTATFTHGPSSFHADSGMTSSGTGGGGGVDDGYGLRSSDTDKH